MVKLLTFISLLLLCSCANSKDIREKWSSKKDGSQFIDIEGTKVHYKDFGSGTPIVLIHGICDSLHTWRKWKEPIVSKGYRFISLDVPGFGLTNGREISYDSKSYTSFLKKLFKRLDIRKPILIGNSLGGFIAWNYALDYPRDVNKLVLLSPAGYPLNPPLVVRIAENGFLKWIAKNFSTRISSDYIARGVFYDRDRMEEYDLERFYELFNLEGNFEKYMRVFESIMKLKDHTPNLTELKTPTLLIWGREDSWIPFKQSKLWQRDVRDLTFIPLDQVGHTAQLEASEKTLGFILSYLND